jgi:hypothetical protein
MKEFSAGVDLFEESEHGKASIYLGRYLYASSGMDIHIHKGTSIYIIHMFSLAPVVDLLTGTHHRRIGRYHSRRNWATDIHQA